jgi:hypothetical protein
MIDASARRGPVSPRNRDFGPCDGHLAQRLPASGRKHPDACRGDEVESGLGYVH